MSLEERIKAYGKQARAELINRYAKTKEKAKQGKAEWIGYSNTGNGLVKQDGKVKIVKVIGSISLPAGSTVMIDQNNTIEIGEAKKTRPTRRTAPARNRPGGYKAQSRPLIIDDELLLALKITGGSGPNGDPIVGDTLQAKIGTEDPNDDPEIGSCPGQYTHWYLCPPHVTNPSIGNLGGCISVLNGIGTSYTIPIAQLPIGKRVFAFGRCPDESANDGFGEPYEAVSGVVAPGILYCPGAADSGGQGSFNRTVNIGQGLGTFSFSYQAYSIPDRFIVTGAASYDTGSTSGGKTVVLTKTNSSAFIYVQVIAPQAGTAWNYSVGCTVPPPQ